MVASVADKAAWRRFRTRPAPCISALVASPALSVVVSVYSVLKTEEAKSRLPVWPVLPSVFVYVPVCVMVLPFWVWPDATPAVERDAMPSCAKVLSSLA